MGRRAAITLAGALAFGSIAAGILTAPTTGASSPSPGSSATASPSTVPAETAPCGTASPGHAQCLVHLFHHRPGQSGNAGYPTGRGGAPRTSTPTGYSPQNIKGAYGFSGTSATGKTIAIVDAYGDPTITSNLATFDSQYGLTCSGCFSKVGQSGGSTSGLATTSGWDLETSLDVEWAHAMAPAATILLVEANNNSNANLYAAVNYAAAHAQYVSMSWGGTETSFETSNDSHFSAPGVSFFAASGDSASSVIYPSSSPHVVSVGGTTLNLTRSTNNWTSESAWSTAGGGCSRYESASSAQAAYATYGQSGCGGKRATPDISLDANPNTGVAVYDTRPVTGLVDWIQVGGTSASTAMIAGRAAASGQQIDATVAYGGSLKIYNVTTGSNGHPCEAGYNLCTGLGSWNTAKGAGGTPTAGSLSFATAAQTLTAGAASSQITVTLSSKATTTVPVALSSSSSGGKFSTAQAGTYAPTLTVDVPTGATSLSFYYEDTKSGSPTISASSTGWSRASQVETVAAGPLAKITVAPSTASVGTRATQTFTASGFDAFTNSVSSGFSPSWSTTVPGSSVGSTPGTSTVFTAGSSAGSGKVTASQSGVSGTASVTVTSVPAIQASISVGTSTTKFRTYHTPLTVTASANSKALSGASVTLDIYGASCSGSLVTSGTGKTNTNGTVTFTFSSRSKGSYCAKATVTDSGYTSATTTTTFSVPATVTSAARLS
jgi:hypothetical protein